MLSEIDLHIVVPYTFYSSGILFISMFQENNMTLVWTSLTVSIIIILTYSAISLLAELPYGQQIKAQSYLPVSSFDSTVDNSSAEVTDDMSNESQLLDNMFDSDNESFITYSNPIYGFDIEYPSDWSFTESDIPPNVTAYSVVNFVPPISADPNLRTNLQIGIEDFEIGQIPSLDHYTRSSINAYRNSYSNFSLDSVQTNSTISGMPAYEIVFTDNSAGATRKSIEKGFIDDANNRAYYLVFNTENSKFDQFLSTIQDAFDSFNLVGSSLFDDNIDGGAANDSFLGFQDGDSSESFFSSGREHSGMAGVGGSQDFERFMNSFADSIFNGSSTFGTVGTSMINGINVYGITIEDKTNYSVNNFSGPDDEENTDLIVSLTSSANNSNNSVSVIAIRIPFNIQNMLSLASLSEGSTISDIGEGTNPLENQELFQDFNPFEILSNLQIGSSSLINPDWSTTQSLTMSLVGGGLTNNSLTQMEEDTLDLVFVSVIPYTGD
jgi:hypothetical protein